MKEKRGRMEIKSYLKILLIVFLIILVFTLIDVLIHSLKEEWDVPDYYYRNKIIYGTIIGFITYLFVKKKNLLTKSLIFSAVISILLQTRYFLEGYPLDFVFEFLFFHFLMLFPPSLIFFKIFNKFLNFERRLK